MKKEAEIDNKLRNQIRRGEEVVGKNVYFVSDALGFLLYCDRKQVVFKKFVTKGGNLIHSLLTQSLSYVGIQSFKPF
jgi:hypothetical protein